MAGESKTEKATPKKRRDERKKGNVFLSKDAIAVTTLFGSFCVLRLTAYPMVEQMNRFLRYCMSCAAEVPLGGTQDILGELTHQALLVLLKTAGPLLAITVITAISITFAQTKFLVAGDSLKPKFSRINPLEGFKRLFSLKSIVESFKNVIKITILLYIIYRYLSSVIFSFSQYLYTDLSQACAHLFQKTFFMVMQIALAFTALALFDFLYQWWDYERQLKMSKHDVKEEYKQMEGNPQIKGKLKELQRKMAQSRMMQQVPAADVIIRNPTHFAVALRYKPEFDSAPVVLAKGQDELALRIIAVAEECHIQVVENVPLARSLYATTELNQEIPPELYGAVAEILVYLYRVDQANKI